MHTVFPFVRHVSRWDFALRVFSFVILTVLLNPDPQRVFDLAIALLLGIMLLAAFVGRIRHAGLSPWLGLTFFIPVFGWTMMLVFMIWRGRGSGLVEVRPSEPTA